MSSEKAANSKFFVVSGNNESDFQDSFDSREEPEVCSFCHGTGWEVVTGKGARPCKCRTQNSHAGLIAKVKIPRRYENCHFQSYTIMNPSQEKAFKFSSKLAMEYPGVDRGLLLMGTCGVGKTHLAVSILKALTERGFSCLFYEFGSLLNRFRILIIRKHKAPN